MPYSKHPILVNVHKIINHVNNVVALHSSSELNAEYEVACADLIRAMIHSGDQLTNALATSILLENGVSMATLSKYVTPDQFKALSRSIRPILKHVVTVENMEQQMQRINMFRDIFMTETR